MKITRIKKKNRLHTFKDSTVIFTYTKIRKVGASHLFKTVP